MTPTHREVRVLAADVAAAEGRGAVRAGTPVLLEAVEAVAGADVWGRVADHLRARLDLARDERGPRSPRELYGWVDDPTVEQLDATLRRVAADHPCLDVHYDGDRRAVVGAPRPGYEWRDPVSREVVPTAGGDA